jgi:hypothetical protein
MWHVLARMPKPKCRWHVRYRWLARLAMTCARIMACVSRCHMCSRSCHMCTAEMPCANADATCAHAHFMACARKELEHMWHARAHAKKCKIAHAMGPRAHVACVEFWYVCCILACALANFCTCGTYTHMPHPHSHAKMQIWTCQNALHMPKTKCTCQNARAWHLRADAMCAHMPKCTDIPK